MSLMITVTMKQPIALRSEIDRAKNQVELYSCITISAPRVARLTQSNTGGG